MAFSRRKFMQWAASASALAAVPAPGANLLPLLSEGLGSELRPGLLPTQKEVWDWQVWMAKLGPKYTGNPAHITFVDFLETQLKAAGLDVTRDHFTLPRWDAHRWSIHVSPSSGASFEIPVTSYFPYSGTTPAEGVTGEIAFAGNTHSPNYAGLEGKIAYADCPSASRAFGQWYAPWGLYPSDMTFPAVSERQGWAPDLPGPAGAPAGGVPTAAGGANGGLGDFQKSGALAVILGRIDISDANAADQYAPFGRAFQNMPCLYVGHNNAAKLRGLAGSGAKATVVLEATVTPDSPTDTLIATLPGMTSDEVIVVNTHTDGPNATEENGGLGVLALAKYFAGIPKAQRKRTIVFVLATGHFASSYVPSIRGFIKNHPDVIQKTVAAVTVEHLGCLEWKDDDAFNYRATGQNELNLTISPHKSTADIMLAALQGSSAKRTAVVRLASPDARFFGEGNALSAAGIPTVAHIPIPDYLCAGPQNGCIEKLSAELMHDQIKVFANVIQQMDSMTTTQLKSEEGS